jgi:DNA repair protein RecO (recombination protein O)
MIESATGIILRTRPLTETSLIVNWLTAEHGRVSTAAKGARRPKSAFAGKLDLFYEGDFTFSRSRRSDLHTLREISLRNTHAPLRTDLAWLQQAAYATTLIEQTTETDTPIPAIHQLLGELLSHLPHREAQPRTIYAFELKLLRELGLQPDPGEIRASPATRELIELLTVSAWEELPHLSATAEQARELRQFLHGFLIYHLGRIPKGRP